MLKWKKDERKGLISSSRYIEHKIKYTIQYDVNHHLYELTCIDDNDILGSIGFIDLGTAGIYANHIETVISKAIDANDNKEKFPLPIVIELDLYENFINVEMSYGKDLKTKTWEYCIAKETFKCTEVKKLC